ncbi:MAG: bacillithiol biosynthesis deacetylase BshB1 [Acidobacteriota bacterium]
MFEPVDVLAVGAHPDDVELGCGGTLLKLHRLGRTVAVLDLTRGELATRGRAEIRRREATRAGRILGLEFRANLGLEDGNVRSDKTSRLELVRFLRGCRPRLVLTHSPWGHPDHWQTSRLVREAAHHSGLARIDTQQERFRPEKIAYWLHFDQPQSPQVVVDISEFYRLKEKALRAHDSQLFHPDSTESQTYLSQPDFLDRIKSQHRHLGNLAGCRLAEGFLLSRVARIDDLTEC